MVLELYDQDFDKFDYSKCTSTLDIELSMLKLKRYDAIYNAKLIKKKVKRKFR